MFQIPCQFIEKDGLSLAEEPLDLKGAKRIAHIADLNNEGSSLRLWNKYVSEAGGNISDAYFLIDRMEDGIVAATELGIQTHAVVELDNEAWDFLFEKNRISQEVYDSLVEYWDDRWEWGRQRLLDHPEPLLKFPQEKTEKILDTYDMQYPGLKEEVITKLGYSQN